MFLAFKDRPGSPLSGLPPIKTFEPPCRTFRTLYERCCLRCSDFLSFEVYAESQILLPQQIPLRALPLEHLG